MTASQKNWRESRKPASDDNMFSDRAKTKPTKCSICRIVILCFAFCQSAFAQTKEERINSFRQLVNKHENLMQALDNDVRKLMQEAAVSIVKLEKLDIEKRGLKLDTGKSLMKVGGLTLLSGLTLNPAVMAYTVDEVIDEGIDILSSAMRVPNLLSEERAAADAANVKLRQAKELRAKVAQSRAERDAAVAEAQKIGLFPADVGIKAPIKTPPSQSPNGKWQMVQQGPRSKATLVVSEGWISAIEIACKGKDALSYRFIGRGTQIKEITPLTSMSASTKLTLDASGVVTQGAGTLVSAMDVWERAYLDIPETGQSLPPMRVGMLVTNAEGITNKIAVELGGMTAVRDDLKRLCAGMPADMLHDDPDEKPTPSDARINPPAPAASGQTTQTSPIVGIWEGMPIGWGLPKKFTFHNNGRFSAVTQAHMGAPIGESGTFSIREDGVYFTYVNGRTDVCRFSLQGDSLELTNCSSMARYKKIGMPQSVNTNQKSVGINNKWVAYPPIMTAEIEFRKDGAYDSRWKTVKFGTAGKYEVNGNQIIFDNKTGRMLRCGFEQTADTLEIMGPCKGTILNQGSNEFVGSYKLKK